MSGLLLLSLTLGITSLYAADSKPTFVFDKTIRIPLEDQNLEIHTFCIDKQGRLLAATGGTQFIYEQDGDSYIIKERETPPLICVFNAEGKHEATWKLDITPEALAVAPDGTIYAAGLGKVLKLNDKGEILKSIDSPHLKDQPLPEIPAELEETPEMAKEKEERLALLDEEMTPIRKMMTDSYKALVEAKKAGDDDAAIRIQGDIETLTNQYKNLHSQVTALKLDKKALAIQLRNAALQARSVRSIAVTDKYVFLCCPPPKGYAAVVWRFDHNFENEELIVKGLSGCCGQMNISAVGDKLAIPENGRFKVHIYDADGTRLHSWGDDERTNAVSGWGSCCNPMNVTPDNDGNILTSEASVGAVKRFKQDGTFLENVALSKIVPGCKHTPIGLSKDGNTVYMLDITQSQVIVMKKQ
jgi:chaperonin cofactor prefoldin